MNVRQAVPFFWVVDMEKSLRFYLDGLGFTRTKQWKPAGRIEWCWLEIGAAALMLQELREPPKSERGKGVSINFLCDDALALYREFTARGIDAQRPFVGNGMWVTSVKDPDGYDLFFESVTDAEEESVYEPPLRSSP